MKCRKDIENINSRLSKRSNGRSVVLSRCAICSKKSRFIKNQEAKGLLSNLGVRTALSKVLFNVYAKLYMK